MKKQARIRSSASYKRWGAAIGLTVALSGALILMVNLAQLSAPARAIDNPVFVQEGLVVRGSESEVFIFHNYAMRQIISPTLSQQRRAQQLSDDTLAQFTYGEPVDASLRPVPHAESPPLIPPTGGEVGWFSSLWGELEGGAALAWLSVGTLLLIGGGIIFLGLLPRKPIAAAAPEQNKALQQMTVYTNQLEQLLSGDTNRQQQQLRHRISRWRQSVEMLANGVTHLRNNNLIQRDLRNVPNIIAALETQAGAESNPVIQAQLKRSLAQRRNQLATLQSLQTTARQSELQIETTVAALGTIYSQLLTTQSTAHVADYSHLLADVDDEIAGLQDYLEALQEVKLERMAK